MRSRWKRTWSCTVTTTSSFLRTSPYEHGSKRLLPSFRTWRQIPRGKFWILPGSMVPMLLLRLKLFTRRPQTGELSTNPFRLYRHRRQSRRGNPPIRRQAPRDLQRDLQRWRSPHYFERCSRFGSASWISARLGQTMTSLPWVDTPSLRRSCLP